MVSTADKALARIADQAEIKGIADCDQFVLRLVDQCNRLQIDPWITSALCNDYRDRVANGITATKQIRYKASKVKKHKIAIRIYNTDRPYTWNTDHDIFELIRLHRFFLQYSQYCNRKTKHDLIRPVLYRIVKELRSSVNGHARLYANQIKKEKR